MDELCTACLCAGRKLSFIGETGSYHLYSQILNEIPVYDFSEVCVRVCWECRALLRRFREFKALVKRSYSGLLQQLHQNSPSSALARPPRLRPQSLLSCAFPDVSVKDEPGDSQGEPEVAVQLEVDQLECKPKLEVAGEGGAPAELVVDQAPAQKRLKKKAVKKTNKEKAKKKLKTKSKNLEVKAKPKRKDDARSASSEDSRLFICDDRSDGDDDNNVPDDNIIPKEKVAKVDVNATKDKIIVLKGVRRKKIDVQVKDEIEVEISAEEVKEPPVRNGLPPRGEGAEPEMLGDKPKCGECGKVFSSKKTYRYHLNVLHKGQNRYPCPRCGKVYQWKSNLGRHMRTHKARDSGELYCATCDKRFASVATYRQHLRVSRRHVSESEFNFMCNECGKKFVNKTRLRDHVDWEHLHNIKFRCQLCNKPFKCHTSLYVHMQNVHRNKTKENLCHICGKSYQNAAKLKYHIVAMHTSETPYQCAQCSAAFGWYSSLYRHVREVHYKMKVQPKKMRKPKRNEPLPPLPPHEMPPPPPPHM